VQRDNSYAVSLRTQGAGSRPQLLWRTQEDGQIVEYLREPARSAWQRQEVKLLSLLPLAAEL
jgi:putative cardiolipin synthase